MMDISNDPKYATGSLKKVLIKGRGSHQRCSINKNFPLSLFTDFLLCYVKPVNIANFLKTPILEKSAKGRF